jgi:hypothetical protein
MGIKSYLSGRLAVFLNREKPVPPGSLPMTDYERLSEEVRRADVLLVEGQSRVSEVIKIITNSSWTHAAIYVGRFDEIQEGVLQNKVAEHFSGDPNEQLIIEVLLGRGTIIAPLRKYAGKHLRICRPRSLSRNDRDQVIAYAINQLGHDYDIRQMLDLARFMLPYSIIPRRWRSTLFEHNPGDSTRNVCSSMLAAAFDSVRYPILPIARLMQDGSVQLLRRNVKLNTPKDFDYSPYFDIIKHPYFNFDEIAAYRSLPWDKQGVICNVEGDCFIPSQSLTAASETQDADRSR